jgi:hypothetical protein
MAAFRFIWLADDQRIIQRRHVECRGMTQALKLAAQEAGEAACVEIWANGPPVRLYRNQKRATSD